MRSLSCTNKDDLNFENIQCTVVLEQSGFVLYTVPTVVSTMSTSASVNSTSPLFFNSHTYFLSQIILSVVIGAPTVFSNVVLLISIYQNPNRNQLNQSPATLFVVNLSVSDLLLGIAVTCGSLSYNIALFNGTKTEDVQGLKIVITVVGILTSIVSSCTIAAMSLDRFLAVSSPLQYRARVTKTNVKIFLVVCWVYALLFSCLGLGVSRTVFILLYCHLHVSFPLIILPVVYWKTYSALRSHNNRVGNLAGGRQTMDIVHRNRERKMISAFLLVLVLFYVTFLPQSIAQNMMVLQPSYLKAESFTYFLYTSYKFVSVNTILNPFIYAWRIPKYRRAFKEVFSRCVPRILTRNAVADARIMSMTSMRRPETTGTELL